MPGGRFLLVMGTRPEVIKLAPVYFALQEAGAEVEIVATNQQTDLLYQALEIFGLKPCFSLTPGFHGQLPRMLMYLPEVYQEYKPDFVIVQGDTTSALAGAIAAFYEGIKIAHVEAGLSSGDLTAPFPEEGHRRMISQIATVNFAPTYVAKANLQEMGARNYHVVGNTVVDALNMIPEEPPEIEGRYILITLHRRESFGEKMRMMLESIGDLARDYTEVKFLLSVHSNPNVRAEVMSALGDSQVTLLIPPPDYEHWVNLMRHAYFIITDSGGIQEEAPSFGVPVLVARNKTERWEAVHLGCSRLVGTKPDNIYGEASLLLKNDFERDRMIARSNPYGDGKAAQRIAEILIKEVTSERVLQAV